jgi:hypothetical protein
MAMTSFRSRLMKLENERRFLNWILKERFLDGLTPDELKVLRHERMLPDGPLPNRPSRLDGVDRKRVSEIRKEDERMFGGRSRGELKRYAQSGVWPKRWLSYSIRDGNVVVQRRIEPTRDIQDPDK